MDNHNSSYINNIDDWIKLFYTSFNEAYQSYLINTPPFIFMNNLLEKIINITNSDSGYILSTHQINEIKYINTEACSSKLIKTKEIILPSNVLSDSTKKYMFTECLTDDKIIYTNDIQNEFLINKEVNQFTQFKTYVCITIKFNNKIIGVLGLADRICYNENMFSSFQIMATLLGTLINNYFSCNIVLNSTENKYISYQLMEHVLDIIIDSTIITDNNFDIIYVNHNGVNLLNSIHTYSIYEKMNLFTFFPKMINHSVQNNNSKLFKNNKFKIPCKLMNDEINILNFVFNSVMCYNKICHVIAIQNSLDNILDDTTIINDQNNFVAFLSHELRNPLQSIILSSYLLNNKLQDSNIDDKTKTQLNIINKSSNDMKRIINDIIDLSKIEAKEFNLEMDLYDVKDITESIYNEYFINANEKNLEFILSINKNIPDKLFTDQVRLSQILSNLISNAIKYTDKGIIILNVSYCKNKKGIFFNVSDTGIGINEDEYCLLFKKYGQTTNSFGSKNNSNGLGLFLSQKLAKLLGGYIQCISEYQKGSTFSFFHPIKLGNSHILYDDKEIQYNLKGKILLVDDDEANLILLKMLLDNYILEYKFDLEIEYTTNGFDAIEFSKINNYDLIFMDINMRGIDGCTTSRIIKNNNNFSGIIIATTGNILAKAENQDDDSKYDCFNHIIIKPYSDLIIRNILNKYLKK